MDNIANAIKNEKTIKSKISYDVKRIQDKCEIITKLKNMLNRVNLKYHKLKKAHIEDLRISEERDTLIKAIQILKEDINSIYGSKND